MEAITALLLLVNLANGHLKTWTIINDEVPNFSLWKFLSHYLRDHDLVVMQEPVNTITLPSNNPIMYYALINIDTMPSSDRQTAYFLRVNTREELSKALEDLRRIGVLRKRNPFFVVTSTKDDLHFWYEDYWKVDLHNVTTFLATENSRDWRLFYASKISKGSECGKRVVLEEVSTYAEVISRKRRYTDCRVRVTHVPGVMPYPFTYGRDGKSPGLWIKPYQEVFRFLELEPYIIIENLTMELSFLVDDMKTFHYVSNGHTDIYAACATRNDSWDNSIDLSHIFIMDQGSWAVPLPREIPRLTIFIRAFNRQIWFGVITTTSIVSLVVFIMSKTSEDRPFSSYITALKQTYLISLSMSSHFWPKTRLVSFLLVLYVVYSMHITTIYQGRISSILTKPLYEEPIKSIKDLAESSLPVLCTGFTLKQIATYDNPDISKALLARAVMTNATGPDRLIEIMKNQNASTGVQTVLVDFMLGSKARLRTFPMDGFTQLRIQYLLRKGLMFYDDFNNALLRLLEGGFYWKWLSDLNIFAPEFGDDGRTVLTLQHLQGSFVTLLSGLSLAMVIFIIDIVKCIKWKSASLNFQIFHQAYVMREYEG